MSVAPTGDTPSDAAWTAPVVVSSRPATKATGAATFGGYLNLIQSGLSLADGQTFGLFSFFSSSGGFLGLSVDGTSLSSLGGGEWAYGGLILSETWTGTTMGLVVSLNAVPEIDAAGMGSVVALVAGALGLLERRRLKVA
jgi:hypothetical protein